MNNSDRELLEAAKELRRNVQRLADIFDDAPPNVALLAVRIMLWRVCDFEPSCGNIMEKFDQALDSYRAGESWTLDEAFGLDSIRKGRNKAALQYRVKFSRAIYDSVQEARKSESSDEALRIVGDEFCRSKESIRELYYAEKTYRDEQDNK